MSLHMNGKTKMSDILTEQEIADALSSKSFGRQHDARKIEAAVIKRLAAGVSVEPYATLHHDDGYFTTKQREHDLRYSEPMRTEVFTLDQLTTAIAAARVQAIHDCDGVIKALYKSATCGNDMISFAIAQGKIRALLGKEQS